MQYLRILIVDDFQPWAHLLETILSKEPLYEVISTARDGHAALLEAERLKPDLVIVDIDLPTINGLDVARSLHRTNPRPFVVFVSQNASPPIVRAAFEAGGSGYVLKTDASQEILNAIRSVCSGSRYLSSSLNEITGW